RPDERREYEIREVLALREGQIGDTGDRGSDPECLERPPQGAAQRPLGDRDHQRRRDDEVAAHVAEPPRPPHRTEVRAGDLPAGEQAADSDGRADRGTHYTGKHGEGYHVPHAFERGAELRDSEEEIRTQERLERVARRDPEDGV